MKAKTIKRKVAQEKLYGRPLSEREIEIVIMAAKGCTNIAIAEDLELSHQTIRHHMIRIGKKLGVHDRTAIVMAALTRGIIDRPEPTAADLAWKKAVQEWVGV